MNTTQQPSMSEKPNNSWENEFEQKFAGATGYCNPHFSALIKEFIQQQLSTQQKELLEAIQKDLGKSTKGHLWVGEDPETEEVRVMDVGENNLWGADMSFAYNLAVQDTLSIIRSHIK